MFLFHADEMVPLPVVDLQTDDLYELAQTPNGWCSILIALENMKEPPSRFEKKFAADLERMRGLIEACPNFTLEAFYYLAAGFSTLVEDAVLASEVPETMLAAEICTRRDHINPSFLIAVCRARPSMLRQLRDFAFYPRFRDVLCMISEDLEEYGFGVPSTSLKFDRQNHHELWPAWLVVAAAMIQDGYMIIRRRAITHVFDRVLNNNRERFLRIVGGLPQELRELIGRAWCLGAKPRSRPFAFHNALIRRMILMM